MEFQEKSSYALLRPRVTSRATRAGLAARATGLLSPHLYLAAAEGHHRKPACAQGRRRRAFVPSMAYNNCGSEATVLPTTVAAATWGCRSAPWWLDLMVQGLDLGGHWRARRSDKPMRARMRRMEACDSSPSPSFPSRC